MRKYLTLLLAVPLAATAACEGDDPFALRWVSNPDTAVVHSLNRPELNIFSAYNLIDRIPVRVEAAGTAESWDFALDTRGGELVLQPPGALGVVDVTAGIRRLPGRTFEDVTEAPSDSTEYTYEEGVPLEEGSVYVIRTRRRPDRFGQLCVFFAKLEPLVVDRTRESLTFQFDRNPICEDNSFIPDEVGT